MSAPSAWTIQAVMAIANATLERMAQDGTLDTDEAALMDALREGGADVDGLLVRLLRAANEASHAASSVDARIMELRARERRFERQHAEYRAAAYAILDALGLTKWRNAEFSVSVSPGRSEVVVTDEAALPDRFVRVTRTPDKAAIKDAIAQGEVIPGVEIANAPPVMTVRTK